MTKEPEARLVPSWLLGLTFTVCLAAFCAYQVPAAFILKGTSYVQGQVEGSIFEAHAEALTVRGQNVQNVSLSLYFWPLLWGQTSARIQIDDAAMAGAARIDMHKGYTKVSDAQFDFTEAAIVFGKTIKSTTSLNSEMLTVDASGRCAEGDFTVSSDLIAQLFAGMGLRDGPILKGQGACTASGRIVAKLTGASTLFRASVETVMIDSVLTNDVVLTPIIPLPGELHALLGGLGFKFDGHRFAGQVTLRVDT